jgi:thioredoxin 1
MELIVTDNNFQTEVLDCKIPCLVDFWAQWCGPCQMVAPVIEEIAEQYYGKIKVVKLDVDSAPMVSSRYGIMSIPTIALFKNGKIKDKIIGAVPKEQIESMFKQYL